MSTIHENVRIALDGHPLRGDWMIPDSPRGVVLFAHGSGSSRLSPRNQFVARDLQQAGFATLLMDLLDEAEEADRANVFDVDLLAARLTGAIDWVCQQKPAHGLPVGLFGASTGAAAALQAATRQAERVRAVVSRGGRPDLAAEFLPTVKAPTLLIVGQRDPQVLQLNRSAQRRLGGVSELCIVPGATHLFEEPGALPKVAALAKSWFMRHLHRAARDKAIPSVFRDRAEAAQHLAARLRGRYFTDPIVLAIPRGGVVLGAILAGELHADLDVVLARKLRMPGNPEFAVGAVSEGGDVYLNTDVNDDSSSLQPYLEREVRAQMEEIARRRELFRQGRPALALSGRSVIVVDDGIATGSTMIAALQSIRMQQPLETIVAVPVAAPDRLEQVRNACDETVCLLEAPELQAVGQYYQDFRQVENEEVIALLNRYDHAAH